ncbi:aminotransferase class I/II-fold pyridoxal phosphate-dependent enzyme [Caminibacter pacificus]|uniref:8-amino-7-oxononanoate synthase n=1 Tax=Caminibacter pacificus TaxID=1424653 RepID=A0AAJ4RBF2_9BACT|nr:pyridoxal phosphate-dependent aminotransferase family protein [Caminibacter pacificus]QCI27509.1 pyridoxal phosphate-dependent aminotransferase family protein [Caminibacter pacificus]ROR38948.1 8-amino-7-oxononanoate synthase [Caminibacter pacificus]
MYKKELDILRKKGRFRERKIYDENIIDLASNDYLGLAQNENVRKNAFSHALNFKSHGAKASMLVNGYHPAHKLLEDYLKELNNFEDALVLGSGFLANMALFELGRKGDLFLVDEEYHASGIVGAKLTKAEVRFFKHNDFEDLKKKSEDFKKFKRVFVVTEGIFSMMGDKVKKEICEFAQEIGFLIIDEAHSVGICGENLLGVTQEYDLNPQKTIKMGTLGKTLGSYGAYILADEEIISYLLNRAKSVIYTTALSPIDSLLAYYALKEIQENLSHYKTLVNQRKLTYNLESLIKIIPAKSNEFLQKRQKELLNRNVLVGAIRPPTVKSPIFRVILRTNTDLKTIDETIKFLGEK